MLLAGGLLNNGFTEYGTVGRGGDGIIGIYSASCTTQQEQSTYETRGKMFFFFLSKLGTIEENVHHIPVESKKRATFKYKNIFCFVCAEVQSELQ